MPTHLGTHVREDIRFSLPAERRSFEVSFALLLRQYRKAAGLTQEELAERATLSVEAISKLERGTNRKPQRETLRLLADALALAAEERAAFHIAGRRTDAPPAAPTAPTTPFTLFAPVTPLVGRTDDMRAVATLLRDRTVRLLTITGVPGVGKTRVALAVASQLHEDYPDGVVFVALAAIREPDRVIGAIAQSLGIAVGPGESVYARVVAYLHSRRVLLALDNFEQVSEAAATVASLLAVCPALTVLVTSRAALCLSSEHIYALFPLALPHPYAPPNAATLARIPAIALFVQRAHATDPAFDLTDENAAIITAICVRLDGLPLALELAASRTRVLPPAAILARLEHSMTLLVSEAADLPARHRTLRSALAWSYDLLTSVEQRLFRRLAVFLGGWTLDAAAAVSGGGDAGELSILDGVESLIAKSLVQKDHTASEPRYAMLETIREYGHELLALHGEAEGVARAHAVYCLALVQGAESEMSGPKQSFTAARLRGDYENLRTAMRWSTDHGEAEAGLRFGWELWRFWLARGWYTEGRAWLTAFLQIADAEICSPLYESVLFASGALAVDQRDYREAETALTQSLSIATPAGNNALIAATHAQLGRLACGRGDLDSARAHCERSLALRRASGTPWQVAVSLQLLGRVAVEQHDRTVARAHLEESLEIARTVDDHSLLANVLRDLGELALAHGDTARAGELLRESLTWYREIGHPWSMARCLDALAEVTARQSAPRDAARLLGAAAALRKAMAAPLMPIDRSRIERTSADARTTLGDTTYTTEWEAGHVLSVEHFPIDRSRLFTSPLPSSPVSIPACGDQPTRRGAVAS